MLWQELSHPEIAALDRELPVLIPLGSIEQHGHHLPVCVDTLNLSTIAARVEERLRDRMVLAPTLWLGASHHHLDMPGALSLTPGLYAQVIKEITLCFLRHGFRRLLFLNGHGGNYFPACHALHDLIATNDLADDATLAYATWWTLAAQSISPDKVGTSTPALSHACEYETSVTLAIRADLVHPARIPADHLEIPRPWTTNPRFNRVEGFHRFHRWTSTGHMGRPELATAEKGRAILDAAVGSVCDFIQEFSRWPHMRRLLEPAPDSIPPGKRAF